MKRKPLLLIALLCFAAVLALDLWFLTGPVNNLYDADSTDTLMWAEAAATAGQPVNTHYYYASVLPFGAHLLMMPFLELTGVSLTTHIIGMVLFWLLMAGAAVFFFRGLRWTWPEALFAASALLLLFGSGRQVMGMYFQHVIYYSLGTLFLLTGMGLLFRVMQSAQEGRKRRALVLSALLGLWMALTATDGVMSLSGFCVPCLGAYALERLLDPDWRLRNRQDRRSVWLFAGLFALMAIGYVVGVKLADQTVGGEYGAYHSTFSPWSNWGGNLLTIPQGWVNMWTDEVKQVLMLSGEGVQSLMGIAFALLFAVIPLAAIPLYRRLETRMERMVVLAHLIMTLMLLFACTFGMVGTRFYGMHDTAILCSLVVLRHGLRHATPAWKRISALCVAGVALFAATCGVGLATKYNEQTDDVKRAYGTIDFLRGHGLTYGYATFWNCNGYTVLSGGDIKIRPVKDKASWSCYVPDTYQSDQHWYLEQPGQDKYFIMLADNEVEASGDHLPEGASEVLTYDRYSIYVYDHFPFSWE